MRPDPLRPYPLPLTPTLILPVAHIPTQASHSTQRYLSNGEAADFLRLSPRTLEKQRVIGGGPRFRKFGRRVMYALMDLEAWADARSFGMTSDPEYTEATAARVRPNRANPLATRKQTGASTGLRPRVA